MTTTTRPAAYAGSPEEILTDIITTHGPRLTDYVAAHFVHGDRFLADDLVQETFIHLWRYHVAPGKVIDDRVFGLLIAIARQMLGHHLRRRRSHEVAVDFTDPAGTASRQAAAPAMDTPHLSALYAELEAAKDVLPGVAGRYRAVARRLADARRALERSVRSVAVARCSARVAEVEAEARVALEEFRAAAGRVAGARAEWNAAAAEHASLVFAGRVATR